MAIRMSLSEAEKVENTPPKTIRLGLNDVLRFDDEVPSAEKPKPRFFQEVAKGAARGFENIAAGVGSTLLWFGEAQLEEVEKKRGTEIERKVFTQIAKWGKKAHEFWRKESQLGIEAPDPDIFRGSFMQNPSWIRGVTIVAESIPSLATATVVTFATGNPVAGASSLGLVEGSEQYVEARKAGKSVGFSSGVGIISTTGNTILEILPLTRFLRGGSKKIVKDIFVGALQEGGEEVAQALWQNSIARIGYDKTRDLTEGMVEGFIGGAGSGGGIGAITSGRGIKTDTLIQEAVAQGVTPKQIEDMHEVVKDQIVANANKIEQAISGEEITPEEPESGVEGVGAEGLPEDRGFRGGVIERIEEGKRVFKITDEEGRPLTESFDTREEAEQARIDFAKQQLPTIDEAISRFEEVMERKATDKEIREIIIPETRNKFTKKSTLSLPEQKPKKTVKPRQTLAEEKQLLEELEELEERKIFGKLPVVSKKETTILRDKIRNIERGIREGKVFAKREVKDVQDTVIKLFKQAKLDIPKSIKSIQTKEQLTKALPTIKQTIARLETAASTRSLTGKIKKALKKTKVKKQAGKPVGKFTAEVQEILDLMRQVSLLSKDEAEAAIQQNIEASEGLLPQEDIRLKNELLTLVSGLDEKTPEALQTILDTIQSMKKTGKVVRRLQRLERKEDIIKKKANVIRQVTGGKGIKPGRETVGSRKTTKEQFHSTMRGLGSKMILSWNGLMETLEFNAGVDSKILGDEFNTLDQDNRYKELTEDFNNDLNNALVESYNIDKGEGLAGKISLPYKIGAKINELQQEVNLGKFKNADGKTVELIFTKDELIKKFMELKDPTLFESFKKGNKITLEMMKAIFAKLTPADRAFARKQFAMYKKQWQKVNPIYRDLFGTNLPFNEFYSPIARENFNLDVSKGFGSFIHDATTRTAVTSRAFKTRIKNVLPLKTQSSITVLERHLKETNYFIAWAERMKVFEAVFKDANVRESINQEFTRSFLNSIDNTINDLSTNGNKWARRLGPVEFFRKNFTLGKLMLKPAIFAKQLVSMLAYLEKINPVAFASGVADFWLTDPLKNYKTLQKESVLIRTRGANMERDIKNATTAPILKAFTKKQNFINLFMLNVKTGDKMAIIMGSWAMRKQRLSEKVALPDIVREYENFSAETQQSSDISRLSEVQRGGSFEKLFTMFKSSQRQYLQKELQAVKSLFQKGGTTPANIKKVAKVIAIYHVLLPVAFQYLANFGGWDEEDRRDYIRAGILGSLNGLFIFGDILDSIIRKALRLRVFSNEVPISTIADDVRRAMGKIDWNDITSEDVVEALGEFIEAGDSVGIPVTSIKNMFIGVSDIIEGDIKAGIAEILGWSPRVVKEPKKKPKIGK